MARLLRKIPNFKLPKYRMDEIEELEELQREYAKNHRDIINNSLEGNGREKPCYPGTDFCTVKEIFENSTTKYADRPFVLETFNKKTGFETATYGEFRDDTINFGTGLLRVLRISEKEKVIIIGETTYEWYVAYMALLLGAGIAVPVDKELPENELENLINRSGATVIIHSPKKKDFVRKAASHCKSVRYTIEMYSDEQPTSEKIGKDRSAESGFTSIGFDFVACEGKVFTDLGDASLMQKEIDPEAFALLIFTSGTTSAAKGVMICNRNLAANINGITPYVNLTPEDRLFSVLPLHHTYESTIGFIYPMAENKSRLQIRNSTVDFLVFTKDAHEDGIEVRVQNNDVWLTQKAIA